ncbi:kh domain containing protein [Gigaspora margarita]|uniref:Kh domain containing protein n=1 Tax=Gigaspora margarita TaxID=4874 RepID=A0A8H4A1B4_GIGMA|nr:kh domain containing protein [Gigaspora margarita]
MSASEHPAIISLPEEALGLPPALPPSVLLQEQHAQNETSPAVEYSNPTESLTSVSYDTDFPSLSAAAAPIAKSPVWGNRSGADLMRQQAPIKKSGVITEILELSACQQLQKKEFGNKTTITDTVKRITNKTNTQIDMSTAKISGTTTFLIKGNIEDVMRAKRELLDILAVKSEETIQIPVSARRFILGTRGQTLQAITSRTGTRIQLPPRQENNIEENEFDYDEDEEMMSVKIEGDTKGINLAKEEITAIVNERTTKRSHRITHIEHHFYPLIFGAHNQRINQISVDTGTKIHAPLYIAPAEVGDNQDHPKDYIIINGERDAIKKAIDAIEEIYTTLKSTTRILNVDIPKRQHKFLIGQKGSNLQEILETTGCSLELPALFDPSEKVVVRGPQSKLASALQIVLDKANSIHVETLDIALSHKTDKPLDHAKNILKYLCNRSKKKIESDNNVQIIVPKGVALEKSVILEFVGKDPGNVENARKEVNEIVKNLPPSHFAIATIEPHLHRHIIGRKGQNLQRVKETYGVEIIVPDEKDESPDILIVFENRDSEEVPTDKKKRESYVKDILEKAKLELIKAGQDASDFATQTLTIPVRFHRHIIGPKGTTLNGITGGSEAPVSVKFGSSRTGAAERSANAEGKKLVQTPMSNDIVVIKGPTEEVERVVKEINKVVEDAKHTEFMNSYTVEFTFPAQYSAHVIGKGGAHVTRLKDKLNVKIDIEGGAKGEEKKTAPGESVKVTIVGMKENAEEAKAKILDLVDKLQDSTIVRLNIPSEYHKSLIGAKGRYVKRLEDKYGVHIRFPKTKDPNEEGEDDSTDAQKPDEVIVKGGKKGVKDAQAELMELLDYERDHDNSESFKIAAQFLPHVVGKNGVKITEIKDETLTRIDLGQAEPSDDDPNQQVIELERLVEEQSNLTVDIIQIPRAQHPILIGRNGMQLREIQSRFNVTIQFPGSRSYNDIPIVSHTNGKIENSEEAVKIIGKAENIEAAKAEILSRVRCTQINVPRKFHNSLISNGVVRKLRSDFHVTLDYADDGVQPEPNPPKNSITNGVATKRIDDDEENSENKAELGWEVVENEHNAVGDIVWNLKGEKVQVERAEEYINDLLKEACRFTHTGYMTIPQQYHRHVIGRDGRTISRIRNESGCKIEVPKSKGDDVIIVTGSQDGVEKARSLIEEIINRAER